MSSLFPRPGAGGGSGVSDLQGAYDGNALIDVVSGTPLDLAMDDETDAGSQLAQPIALLFSNDTPATTGPTDQRPPSASFSGHWWDGIDDHTLQIWQTMDASGSSGNMVPELLWTVSDDGAAETVFLSVKDDAANGRTFLNVKASHYVSLGSQVQTKDLTANDDLVLGKLQCLDKAYFGQVVECESLLKVEPGGRLQLWSDIEFTLFLSALTWSTVQTVHTAVWGLGDTAKTIIFCDKADDGDDLGVPAQLNPSVIFFSAAAGAGEWGGWQHDGTNTKHIAGTGGVELAGALGVGAAPITNMVAGDILANGGSLVVNEITTPTADAGFHKIYGKINNLMYHQDGAGVEHKIQREPSHSEIYRHGAESTTTIVTQNIFAQIVDFEYVSEEDDSGNVTGDPVTNNNLTVNANGGGVCSMAVQTSFRTTGGAAVNMILAAGVELATPIVITSSTDATPIVVTAIAHGRRNGDMVRISGHTTNVAANTDARLANVTDDTFEMLDLSGDPIAGSGGGAGADGSVDTVFPGNVLIRRKVSQSDSARGADEGKYRLVAGDAVKMYVANLDSDTEYVSEQHSVSIVRVE